MRQRRIVALTVVLFLSVAAIGVLAVTADDVVDGQTGDGEPYPGDTLVTVQAYGWFGNFNGDAFLVNPDGERVWEYAPDDAAMFDGEKLDNGNVMVSYGQWIPNEECPEEYQDTNVNGDHCVKNIVEEVDPDNDNEQVWVHSFPIRRSSDHRKSVV